MKKICDEVIDLPPFVSSTYTRLIAVIKEVSILLRLLRVYELWDSGVLSLVLFDRIDYHMASH